MFALLQQFVKLGKNKTSTVHTSHVVIRTIKLKIQWNFAILFNQEIEYFPTYSGVPLTAGSTNRGIK